MITVSISIHKVGSSVKHPWGYYLTPR